MILHVRPYLVYLDNTSAAITPAGPAPMIRTSTSEWTTSPADRGVGVTDGMGAEEGGGVVLVVMG